MTSAIPPSEFSRIQQTNSSPEDIASLLNEAERTHLSARTHLHGNRRYVFPFWKVCAICSAIFPCHNRYQAARNQTCSKPCAIIKIATTGERGGTTGPRRKKPLEDRPGMVNLQCATCKSEFWRPRAWVKGRQQTYCSRECNGVQRGKVLAAYASTHSPKWTQERKAKASLRMRGPNNHAWKGGVTYFRKHGGYKPIKYVRCPVEFIAMARKDGYVMEHRLLVAQAIGRPLLRSEVVHHKDHDPQNNDLINLQLFASNRDHKLYEHHGTPAPIWSL